MDRSSPTLDDYVDVITGEPYHTIGIWLYHQGQVREQIYRVGQDRVSSVCLISSRYIYSILEMRHTLETRSIYRVGQVIKLDRNKKQGYGQVVCHER
jgi:hypothetical protein